MYLPLGLELNVLWVNDPKAIENEEKFDIEIPDNAIEQKPVMFYEISNVKPISDTECYVSSGGEEYVVTESYESVNSKIRNQIIYKLN